MCMDARETLNAFLDAWKKMDWKKAVEYTQITWRNSCDRLEQDPIQVLGNMLESLYLPSSDFTLVEVCGCATKFRYKEEDHPCIVVCETDPYTPSLEGKWGVNPLSLLHYCKLKGGDINGPEREEPDTK